MKQCDKNKIKKTVFDNGLTVLVYPVHTVPKVSTQLWYRVGSKDEQDGQRGLAHLLEHMVFKGTNKLSETDINLITSKMAGYSNAFTSYDYTGYLFDFPTQNWTAALDLLADCMRECTLKKEYLDSEFKAVIQELKMYRDDYESSLIEEMMKMIFIGHPYSFPIIGYKKDLWQASYQSLQHFYSTYYTPNNATLVVVGDGDYNQITEKVYNYFGAQKFLSIPNKKKFNSFNEIVSRELSLYRDIAQPFFLFTWVIPGLASGENYYSNLLTWIIGKGRSSRLYKKLVLQGIATEVDVFVYSMFEHSLFCIQVYTSDESKFNTIKELIVNEVKILYKGGINKLEIERAIKQMVMEQTSLFDDTQSLAYSIGESFLATGDAQHVLDYVDQNHETIQKQINHLIKNYIRYPVMHIGKMLPLIEQEKSFWIDLQTQSDKEDDQFISSRVRESEIEPSRYAVTMVSRSRKPFIFPQEKRSELRNGMTLLWYDTDRSEKIEIIVRYKVQHHFDPPALSGLYNFVCQMILEGTERYCARELADEFERRGMSITIQSNYISISLLKDDLEKALSLLHELLQYSIFSAHSIERVRAQIISEIKEFWDTPTNFVAQIASEQVYGDHPYSANILGTEPSIKKITRNDLYNFYKKYFSPHGACIAVVGDLSSYDVIKVCEETIGRWSGPLIQDTPFPPLGKMKKGIISYPINRDQLVLCFATRSLRRLDTGYDALSVFDYIFTGGVSGSTNSRLFQLREKTGLFYTIGGSFMYGSSELPGMIYLKTMVSHENCDEAQTLIQETISSATQLISRQKLQEAKNNVINQIINDFESNYEIARNLLFFHRYNLPTDYFENRVDCIQNITDDQVREVVNATAHLDRMCTIKIGRVGLKR